MDVGSCVVLDFPDRRSRMEKIPRLAPPAWWCSKSQNPCTLPVSPPMCTMDGSTRKDNTKRSVCKFGCSAPCARPYSRPTPRRGAHFTLECHVEDSEILWCLKIVLSEEAAKTVIWGRWSG